VHGNKAIRLRLFPVQFNNSERNSQLLVCEECVTTLGCRTGCGFQSNSPFHHCCPFLHSQQCRKLISDYNTVTDPLGVQARRAGRIRRRVFYAAGVNHMWAFDQHDKWQKYGLRLHIGVEPFTGLILWLIIWWNNSNPKVPARQYFNAIRRTGGMRTSCCRHAFDT